MIARLLAAAVMLAPAGCGQRPPDSGVHILRYASPYTSSHPLSRADQRWFAHLEAASGGRLRVKPSWAGGMISSEHNMIELRHGVVDVATISPIYSRGGTHAIRLQAGFYGGERSIDQQVGIYRCLATSEPRLAEEMTGLVPLAVQGGNVLGIVTRTRPVRRLEDLKGLRLRVPGELVPLLQRLGADPLDMPMADVYPAMAKGVIDGVVAPADTLKALHFAEVARYFNTIRLARGAYPARAISEASLRRLPPALQRIVRDSAGAWEAAIAAEFTKAGKDGIDYARSLGMILVPADPAAQAKLDALYLDEAGRAARDDPALPGATMLATAQATLRAMNAGRRPACAGAPL